MRAVKSTPSPLGDTRGLRRPQAHTKPAGDLIPPAPQALAAAAARRSVIIALMKNSPAL